MRMFWRTLAVAGAMGLGSVAVQAQGSPYVPLDDIAYRYADALIARGELRDLSVLERPYTARALAAAADSVLHRQGGDSSASAVVRSYAASLLVALRRYGDVRDVAPDSAPIRIAASIDVFATAQSSGVRELMQADTNESMTGGAGVRLVLTGGPVAAVIHPIVDNRLNNDPEFAGRKDRKIAGRTEDAYVSGQWPYAELFLGRIGRQWGPYALDGLQLNNYAYTYDQLYTRFGVDAVHVSSLAAKLDDDFQPEGVYARYFYTHRLGITWRNLELGVNEGYIATGIGRSYDLSLINPLNIYALSWRNEKNDGNMSLGGTLALRSQLGVYSGELYIDDVQIDRCNPVCKEPSSYGLTASAEGVPLVGDQRLFASYTRLTGLAYRTPKDAERYASFGIGLGSGYTDYDEARLGVDLAVVPYVTARMYGAYRRQGEGDYRLPYPPTSAYPTLRGFLLGTVEHVARLGITGGALLTRDFEITTDLGVNHSTNAGHVAGQTTNAFEGRIRIQWTPPAWRGYYSASSSALQGL